LRGCSVEIPKPGSSKENEGYMNYEVKVSTHSFKTFVAFRVEKLWMQVILKNFRVFFLSFFGFKESIGRDIMMVWLLWESTINKVIKRLVHIPILNNTNIYKIGFPIVKISSIDAFRSSVTLFVEFELEYLLILNLNCRISMERLPVLWMHVFIGLFGNYNLTFTD
jgi:hypothetical protein